MNEPIHEIIFERLAADGTPAEIAEIVLAAVSGEDDLAAAIDGKPTTLDIRPSKSDEPKQLVYLSSVTVSGFRGVGPERTLAVRPGPGLTLVVGRNGSGKSSFAEAVELSLTGDSIRWADRNSVWRTGWRNLHSPVPCGIVTELLVDGDATPTLVRRSWRPGAELGDAQVTVSTATAKFNDLQSLGLGRPLELYRPFLTAADLGKLIAGTPSELFDALAAILGMEAITDADKRLSAAIRAIDSKTKAVRARRDELREKLAEVDDERVHGLRVLLQPTQPDLEKIETAVSDRTPNAISTSVAACEMIAALAVPDPDHVLAIGTEVLAAARAAEVHNKAESRAAVHAAELLRVALDYHDDAGDNPCPVCHAGVLDRVWRMRAEAELDSFRVRTGEARRAAARHNEAVRKARALAATPIGLPATNPPEVPLDELRAAAVKFANAPRDPADLPMHLVMTYQPMADLAEAAIVQAQAWLATHDTTWQELVIEVRLWLAEERRARDAQSVLARLKAAREWLRTCEKEIRDDRLAPFADHSQRIWQQLRQDSNVELGAMSLTGTNTRRRVEFPVRVDGVDNGVALGVMSQGELHALGLAAFLPRSCAPESPFRFVVIDDPVQSMDPAKVDGLARVLAELAIDRQVIVFTHDDRLPEAIRNLELEAEIIEVLRAEQSVLTLRTALDPVSRYLNDADAVAYSADVPDDVRAPVVAELCRSALEAACHRIVWRRRVARGDRHAEVEAAIHATAKSVTKVFALAMFDDADRGSDVLTRLNQRYGAWSADAYQACRKGVHGHYLRDLRQLVRDCRRLTEAMA